MDVSLRHWPIFVTGLLLGAAGTMSLGLHRPTQAELAAAAPASVAKPAVTPAASAPVATLAQAGPEVGGVERADDQMRVAAEAFRTQELQAAAAMPVAVALAQPAKPRVRRVLKEADVQAGPAPIAVAPAIAIAPNAAPEPPEALARPRAGTSVMGAAAEDDETRPQPE